MNEELKKRIQEQLELFRKQCINKGGGQGFEATLHAIASLMDERVIEELEATLADGDAEFPTDLLNVAHNVVKRIAELQKDNK